MHYFMWIWPTQISSKMEQTRETPAVVRDSVRAWDEVWMRDRVSRRLRETWEVWQPATRSAGVAVRRRGFFAIEWAYRLYRCAARRRVKMTIFHLSKLTVIRPPDTVCRRTYILPVFLSSFFHSFFRPLISEVAERNSTKIDHTVGSKGNLKTHVRNLGYPFPLQIGGHKTTFLGRLRNLTATLTAYVFGKKHNIDNRSSALTTTRGLLHRSKMVWTLAHKRLKTRPAFLPTLHKFCILLHCQASLKETSKRNSTKLCQVMGSKSP